MKGCGEGMKIKEVYRHFIRVEYNDGIDDIMKSYEYFSTEFMNNDEFKEQLEEIEKDIDCPNFRVIQFTAERRVL